MTPEIEKKRLELFEAWFDKEVLPTIGYGRPDILKRQMWRPFNAALDAVEIFAVDQTAEPKPYHYDHGTGDARYIADIADHLAEQKRDELWLKAIESTGLGLQIK